MQDGTVPRRHDDVAQLSWFTAIAIGLGVGVLLGLVLLFVPHLLLTRLLMLSRDVRVALATLWIAGATVALLVAAARYGRAPTTAP